jgi:hypothetical protein
LLSRVANDPVAIDKSLDVKGELIGCGSLYIDGEVMGTIYLPVRRITVWPQWASVGRYLRPWNGGLGEVHRNIEVSGPCKQ